MINLYQSISSQDNPKYKAWLKLTKHKYRSDTGMYLIEGILLIRDALRSGASISQIIVKEDEGDITDIIPKELLAELIAAEIPVYGLKASLYDKLSQTETGRSVMGVVEKKKAQKTFAFASGRSRNAVVLDKLQDPGNIGTIIRTADGAGFSAVIAMKGTADIYSPKVVRAAAGSLFRISIIEVENIKELKEITEAMELKLVSTEIDGEMPYYKASLSEGIALIIGNEGAGVSKELSEEAEMKLTIPMFGQIDSLNASVAAGVVMYESMRQRLEKVDIEKNQ